MSADTYQVSDGKPLFELGEEKTGGCTPNDVAGGKKLLVLDWCLNEITTYGQIKEVDPKSGEIKWRYRLTDKKTKKTMAWKFNKVYSVDPLVVSVHESKDQFNWSVIALKPNGKLRSTINGGKYKFEPCAGSGDSGRGAQNCDGDLVGKGLFYLTTKLAGEDLIGRTEIVAFDLDTGKVKWRPGPRTSARSFPWRPKGRP
ncbi:hypothetical protein [Streptomyces sp. NPDC020681]|uniref:hypothetical protein n=1 Tax=Streptomyces sp. NPDC020681 TaxID=3365083 RepID=UPI0037B3D283